MEVDVLMDECVSNLKLQAQEGSSACVQLGTCMIMAHVLKVLPI